MACEIISKTSEEFQGESETEELSDIQAELERMNASSEEINKLEKELEEARSKFRTTLTESSSQLNHLLKKQKRSIERSRHYFNTLDLSHKTQNEAQQAANTFRRAQSFYKAAKETIKLAERRLEDEDVSFNDAWQEMLNHSTEKMLQAEKEKMRCELLHHRKSLAFQELEKQVVKLEKSHKRSIRNARPYYDMKNNLERQLQAQKQNVEDLQKGVSIAKLKYKTAMSNLETISEQIHERRLSLPAREPGVGCDSSSSDDDDSILETDLEKHMGVLIRSDSQISNSSTDADSVYSFSSGSSSHSIVSAQSSVARLKDFVDSATNSPIEGGLRLEDELSTLSIVNDFDCINEERIIEGDSQSGSTLLEEDGLSVIERRPRENTLIICNATSSESEETDSENDSS